MCKGRISYDKNNVIRSTKHNHQPEVALVQKRKLIQEMIIMAKETLLHTKQIFDEVCRKYVVISSAF